ncbi:MAG: RNA-protein complex protein Nop10 [Halobacteriaceae archaeon]
MSTDINVCRDWEHHHERPVYTLDEACPDCGGAAVASEPAPFSPEDPHGEYRRAAKFGAGE